MLLAGDEFLRTQRGNNNAWCQDNEISWVDWALAAKNADFLRFVREMIALRKRHPALRRRTLPAAPATSIWHGVEPDQPDFSPTAARWRWSWTAGRPAASRTAISTWPSTPGASRCRSSIPPAPQGRPWRRVIDTALASPLDIVGMDEGPVVRSAHAITSAPYSLIVLIAEG